MIAALVIGLVSATVGLILKIVLLPFIFLTLGLVYFLINGLMLKLASELVPGFRVHEMSAGRARVHSFNRGGLPAEPPGRRMNILSSGFVGENLKTLQYIRAERRGDGDIRRIASARYQHAPDARHIITRIEGVPRAA